MAADGYLQRMFLDVCSFHHNLITNHNRRSDRSIEGKVLVGEILSLWFRDRFDIDHIFSAQPGHHLFEVFSRLTVGLIQKEMDFEHSSLL